jgi:hypothetical protein
MVDSIQLALTSNTTLVARGARSRLTTRDEPVPGIESARRRFPE